MFVAVRKIGSQHYAVTSRSSFVFPVPPRLTDYYCSSKIKELPELGGGVIGAPDGVTDGPGVLVDLIVVAALEGLVAKEVDGGVLDATGPLGLVLEVLEAVGLVPAGGEDVEGDLAADGEAVKATGVSISVGENAWVA